jgi:AAA domain
MATGLFRTAQRRKAKLRLGLDGPSGSGKTYSALLIAKGLAGGDLSKVALIDTENGSGDLYSDLGPYAVLTFGPPYSVQRFVKAHDAAVAEGFEVIVIDSLTHFWSGEGGILDAVDKIAATSTSGNSFAAWKKGTPLQKLFMDTQLASPCHIIATVRSKVEWVLEENEKGKKVPRKVGLAPEQRKDLDYEYTLMLDLSREHIAVAGKDRTGLFEGRLEVPTEAMGAELLAWLEGGADVAAPSNPLPVDTEPPAPAAGNGHPTTINPLQQGVIKSLIEERNRTVDGVVAVLNRKGVCPGGLDTVPIAAYEDVVVAIRDLKPLEKAPETPQEPAEAPAVAEAPAAPQAATEPPQDGESSPVDGGPCDENGMPDDDFMGAENKPVESALRDNGDGDKMAAAPQLRRLGIICSHLEANGIMWRPIAVSVIGHEFESRKEYTFDEARDVIKTLSSIEKTLPEAAKAS